MAKIPFRERIRQAEPLLADGAMGTMLHEGGASIHASFDELNLTQPQQVAAVHHAYIQAGANLIETNTFGANRFKLAENGLGDQVAVINQAAVEIARREIDASWRDDVYLAGSVGPLG
ncbi:MAG: homocysteine S-methyltransferase family protein, partial [Anaerolineae bacterium]|nr:homocysteine S-methyltransferase family protein [Anaerolineae bacterium]